ncbi:MAG TPA: LacI family DNA-binding transcriptional regulator, partial [Firmicutes bacterium]|nr:LacI family DNA-binding transcriptional regulator [Bacillota bacterium]
KARMLLKMVEKRQKTLKNIFQEIVNHQKNYFEGGNLVPLKEKEVAEKVGVSISTVSRAINRKYLLTPRGIVKVKDLFTGGIGNISRKFIVEKMKEILKSEKKPLSDREIAEKLKEYGIDISTRTVNKYRNREGILNSYLR